MSATAPTTLSGTWVSDPVHSNASFAIRHMIVSTFRANFAQVEATVEIDGDDIRLTGKVPAESIDVEHELTVRDNTRPIKATGIIIGPAVSFGDVEVLGLELQTTVDKNDFGLNWNAPLPKGGFAISDQVTL